MGPQLSEIHAIPLIKDALDDSYSEKSIEHNLIRFMVRMNFGLRRLPDQINVKVQSMPFTSKDHRAKRKTDITYSQIHTCELVISLSRVKCYFAYSPNPG